MTATTGSMFVAGTMGECPALEDVELLALAETAADGAELYAYLFPERRRVGVTAPRRAPSVR